MRSREHIISNGYMQEIDGTNHRRNLSPIEAGIIASEVVLFTWLAVSVDLRMHPKEVATTLYKGGKALVNKEYRQQLKEQEELEGKI